MLRWLAAVLFLLPSLAHAATPALLDCAIDFALPEVVGPAESDALTISVIPYDASTTGGVLALCVTTTATNLLQAIDPDSPPGGVSCATDSSWAAAERVDLRVTGLTPNSDYHYRVYCDAPDARNPGNYWGSRPADVAKTLPTPGTDVDLFFTSEFDSHFGTRVLADTGMGRHRVLGPAPLVPIGPSQDNSLRSINAIANHRPLLHFNLGDFYQSDGQTPSPGVTNSVESSLVFTPRRRGDSGTLDTFWSWTAGQYLNPVPGYPTRNSAGCSDPTSTGGCAVVTRTIQNTETDPDVQARARWRVWDTHRYYQPIDRRVFHALSWGNHDNPLGFNASNTSGAGCVGQFPNDGQPTPKTPGENMIEGRNAILVNPATYYPPQPIECDPTGAPFDPACDTRGSYYTFSAGLAQFWIVNAFMDTGGKGSDTDGLWSLTGQIPTNAADWSIGEAQFNWLTETVEASTAKWKFVFLHHAVGGNDLREQSSPQVYDGNCYWYARAALLSTARYCDDDADGLAGPYDSPDDGGKRCTMDDSSGAFSFSESEAIAEDTRGTAWEQQGGACATGILCLPSPYDANRSANAAAVMLGDPSYGQEGIQTLLEANLDDGGSNFIYLGHDHTTAGGCKFNSDGCSEVWYITGGQPTGDGDGSLGDGPAFPGQDRFQGAWDRYWDFNGDGRADYRTDGPQYQDASTLDTATGTIRRAGTMLRGFGKTFVSDEGVQFVWESIDGDDYPLLLATDVLAFNIGEQALHESDFDGSGGPNGSADGESKHPAPSSSAGPVDCNRTDAPLLEGTQSCQFAPNSTLANVFADTVWTSSTGLRCADYLFHPVSDSNNTTAYVQQGWRNASGNNGGQLRGIMSQIVCGTINGGDSSGDGCWILYDDGNNADADASLTWTNGTTYQIRYCYDGATDHGQAWIDACDPNDDNCDGKHDSSGAEVAVPTWGTGSFDTLDLDGPATAQSIDGWRFASSAALIATWRLDAMGVCDHNPQGFKCGDGFE